MNFVFQLPFVFLLAFPGLLVDSLLEPTKIIHNGVYKMEIQSEDKFLTGVENGLPIRSVWRNNPEQKWRFTETMDSKSGKQAWVITPLTNFTSLPTLWKITYAGHGKFRFRSFASDLCLRGQGGNSVVEAKCESDDYDPGQRWLILDTN